MARGRYQAPVRAGRAFWIAAAASAGVAAVGLVVLALVV